MHSIRDNCFDGGVCGVVGPQAKFAEAPQSIASAINALHEISDLMSGLRKEASGILDTLTSDPRGDEKDEGPSVQSGPEAMVEHLHTVVRGIRRDARQIDQLLSMIRHRVG
ncbi:hypothetical protein [Methylobacterium sp.]|uniref:hypothetical protein n=1 Tax=Methylobacterium sp. TaxID=409 RepID=UPI0015CB2695|nr:hypothetical protein [Methylobacterium sp.]